MTYRFAQVLTGHGVLDVHRQKGDGFGFAVHPRTTSSTRVEKYRKRLVEDIGPDLSIRGLVNGLLRGPREWSAISRFSEAVLRTKEDREREREKFRSSASHAPGKEEKQRRQRR